MPGTLTSAGNLLLSFAILVAGGCASKVLRIFGHMGLGRISLSTFFRHQRVSSKQINHYCSKIKLHHYISVKFKFQFKLNKI